MSSNNQNQAMQRFFEFVFNVPGDCFCCTWSISCFLETVEHMEGDKRWRSICTLGMSVLSLLIVFLLSLALCPKFYWSEINQIVLTNSTVTTSHFNYSTSTYLPTYYINSTEYDLESDTYHILQPPTNDIANTDNEYDEYEYNIPHNTTTHSVIYQHIGLHLNLWHINYCTKNESNITIYKTFYNNSFNTNYLNNHRRFMNNTYTITNESCSFITYRESGTTSSTQDLSLWFIILVIALLFLGSGCVLATHPLFDRCHKKNTTLRSSIQKILAIAITILCACILNWSSFVFAAVFENQVEKYQEWQEKKGITQSNLGTGMLAVNGAMLLGIILSVIHCGAPIRTDLNQNSSNNNNDNDDANNNDNNNGDSTHSAHSSNDVNENENDNGNQTQQTHSQQLSSRLSRLTHEQRMLLRRIPGGNSSMGNIAILANPDRWFKKSTNNNDRNSNDGNKCNNLNINNSSNNNNDIDIIVSSNGHHDNDDDNKNDNVLMEICEDNEFKEFEYQNMNLKNDKTDDDKKYSSNLSMKRLRKCKTKQKNKKDEMKISLLSEDKKKINKKDVIVPLNKLTSTTSDNDSS